MNLEREHFKKPFKICGEILAFKSFPKHSKGPSLRPKAHPLPGASGVSDSEITGSEAAGVKHFQKSCWWFSSIFF